MARKFTSFSDFSKERKPIDEAAGAAQAKLDATKKVTEVKKKIQEAGQDGDPMEIQILKIDLQLAQLDLQKTDLSAQKEHLTATKAIADANKKRSEDAAKEKE